MNGISRDHMLSVSEGYKQKINPLLLAHPANCKLLRHNDNISKGFKCSINIEELKEKINEWELKYGSYYKNKLETYINLNSLK